MAKDRKKTCRFTHEWLDAVQVEKRTIIYDSGCPGLIVRIGAGQGSSRVFYWYGRLAGSPTYIKIGAYPKVSVPAARDEAKRIAGSASMGQATKSRATIARDELTLGLLFNWYMTTHAKPHKRTWREDKRNYEKRMSHWANRKLSTITKKMVKDLHIEINGATPGGPYAANKMLELLGFMYRLGRSELDISASDPTNGIRRFPKVERDRFLNRDELPRFIKAVNGLQRQTTKDFVMLALLTGARRSNVCSMKWSDVDLKERVWRISIEESKNKRPMKIVLSDAAMKILKRRKTEAKTKFVLPGSGTTGHIVEPKHAIQKIMADAKLEDVRFHDLRRTLGSWQAAQGASMIVIGKSLGQTSQAATRVYARLDLDPVRESVEQATMRMMESEKQDKKK